MANRNTKIKSVESCAFDLHVLWHVLHVSLSFMRSKRNGKYLNRIDVRITRSVQVFGTCFACVMRMVSIFMAISLSSVASRYVETAMLRNALDDGRSWWMMNTFGKIVQWRRMCVKTSSTMNSALRLATIDLFNGIQICFRHFRVRSKHMPEIGLLSNSIPIFFWNAFEQIVITFFSFAPKAKRSLFGKTVRFMCIKGIKTN